MSEELLRMDGMSSYSLLYIVMVYVVMGHIVMAYIERRAAAHGRHVYEKLICRND